MKIELNPCRMTINELTDCIAELTAQRNRLLEEEREVAEVNCVNAFLSTLHKIWNYTEDGNFNVALDIKTTDGHRYYVPLDMASIKEWNLKVVRKPEQ